MTAKEVGIVVVSFGTRDKTLRCLGCIPPWIETVIVDNGSSDDSVAAIRSAFPTVRLIEAGRNLGFGAANNLGEATLTTPLVLYLNSDAYLAEGSLDALAAPFSHPDVVATGGHLRNPDGTFQPCAAGELTLGAVFREQFFLERSLGGYWCPEFEGESREVAQCMGAALCVRRGLERFDERFFLYCEDTDLCRRLRGHGRILHVPAARLVHDLGSSSSARRWMAVARYNAGKELYFRLHHGVWSAALCFAMNRAGALVRLLIGLLTVWSAGGRARAMTFLRVLFTPPSGPTRPS